MIVRESLLPFEAGPLPLSLECGECGAQAFPVDWRLFGAEDSVVVAVGKALCPAGHGVLGAIGPPDLVRELFGELSRMPRD